MKYNLLITFLSVWHDVMEGLAVVLAISGVAIYLAYKFRVSKISDYRKKYDYINLNEIKWLKAVFYCFGLSVAMMINTYAASDVKELGVWFFVRAFASISGATIIGYVSSLLLDFYYPSFLIRKLNKCRYMPRTDFESGKTMHLLEQEEHFVLVDATHETAEGVYSFDYDVWIGDTTGNIIIEKYAAHDLRLMCGNCGFHTMRVVDEETIDQGEQEMELDQPKKNSELLRHYLCSYCQTVRSTQFYIASEDIKDCIKKNITSRRSTDNVYMIKIVLSYSLSGKQTHEFRTTQEAKDFFETLRS